MERMRATKGRAVGTSLGVASLLLLVGDVCSSAMPAALAGGDLISMLRECGEAPFRTVSCIGAQGSGKTTLLSSMWSSAPEGLALLEATSSVAYVPETNEVEVGAGRAIVSLAVSDATIYNVLVQDLGRPDALSDIQVGVGIAVHFSNADRTLLSTEQEDLPPRYVFGSCTPFLTSEISSKYMPTAGISFTPVTPTLPRAKREILSRAPYR